MGETYIQHNPNVADGRQAIIDATKIWFKGGTKSKIKFLKIIAEKDLVFLHIKGNYGQGDISIMDVFRIEDNKIIEHWDAIQAVPEKSANDHPMF